MAIFATTEILFYIWIHFSMTNKESVSTNQHYTKSLYYSDIITTVMASQITGVSIVCSFFWLGEHHRKHQSSASLTFVRGIHNWSVDSPLKGPVARKTFPLDDVIME